jgi:hypothetical protein
MTPVAVSQLHSSALLISSVFRSIISGTVAGTCATNPQQLLTIRTLTKQNNYTDQRTNEDKSLHQGNSENQQQDCPATDDPSLSPRNGSRRTAQHRAVLDQPARTFEQITAAIRVKNSRLRTARLVNAPIPTSQPAPPPSTLCPLSPPKPDLIKKRNE